MVDTLFTIESLLSLQGAAVASLLVPNVLGYVIGKKFDKFRKYISLLIAFSLAFLVAYISEIEIIGWVVATFNGFLIFASAVGINQMTTRKKTAPKKIIIPKNKKFMRTKINPKTGHPIKLKGKSKEMFRKEFPLMRSKPAKPIPKKQFFSNWF